MGVRESSQDFEGSMASPEELEADLAPGIYGRKEIITVPLRQLVVLSQVRNVPNPEAENIRESIKATGLINQIDVARLDREAFEAYIDFVNRVWGDEFSASSFPPADDGYTYLVVAGHTRVEAMIGIEDEKVMKRIGLGLPLADEQPMSDVKIWHNMTPDEIIALQLNENLHRQPPKERSAMAIVEAYLYGLENGQWANKADFLRNKERKFSRSTLNDALNFAELPSHIRDFVLAGGIPYRAGVELGKTLPIYKEYTIWKYFDGRPIEAMDEEESAEFHKGILEWLGSEVAHIQHARQKGRFSGAVIEGRYNSYRRNFESEIRKITGQDETAQLEITMSDTLADWRIRRRRLREQYTMMVKELSAQPLGRVATLIGLHNDLLGKTGSPEEAEDLLQNIERHYVSAVKRHTGAKAAA